MTGKGLQEPVTRQSSEHILLHQYTGRYTPHMCPLQACPLCPDLSCPMSCSGEDTLLRSSQERQRGFLAKKAGSNWDLEELVCPKS